MEYTRIVAVTGLPGLFEVLSSKTDGAILRSLEDQSTKFVSSRIHNLSHLESIEVYTTRENVTLSDIFTAMKNSGEKLPDGKDNKSLRAYFEKVYPELDFERVYPSDMKKMIRWFEVLEQNKVDFSAKSEMNESEEVKQAEPEIIEKTPTEPVATETVSETPKPKRTRKKKTE